MPLRVSGLGPVLSLACSEGGGPVPFPPTWLGAARSPWGGCGRADPSPTPPRALLRAGLARWISAVGAAQGRPGGAALAWVRGTRGWALSHLRPLVLSGVRPGPTTHWLWVRGVRARGPVTNPTADALASWLCALWGGHEGAWGGAPHAWVCGVRGQALSHPGPLVRSGVRPGPTTHCLWVRGVRAWGPVTNPTARALASWLCALWGRHEGARGRAPHAWVCGVRGRALPHPRPPLRSGVRPGPTTHCLWVRGVRAWGVITNPTARALACCGGGMRVPGGGASCLGLGRLGSGALPPPTTRPFGHAAGAHYPFAVGAGNVGVGPRHQPHRAHLCVLALRAVVAA